MNGGQADIVRLTKAAAEAAQQGRWDEVIQYYSERGPILTSTPSASFPADDLLRMDEEVRDRVRTTQAVLEDLLVKVQITKRQVQEIRQRLAVLPAEPEAVSIEA